MTPEEFKKHFKVGDTIKAPHWVNSETITAIGDRKFLSYLLKENEETVYYFDEYAWQKVEPKKKYVMYRHWYITEYDKLSCIYTDREELHGNNIKLLETEVLKTFEV